MRFLQERLNLLVPPGHLDSERVFDLFMLATDPRGLLADNGNRLERFASRLSSYWVFLKPF